MTERVMFKASRPFTVHVAGEGMVVFNAAKKDDKGTVVREATTAELPMRVATEYAERGYGEMTGKGARKVKALTGADRRARRLEARKERRARAEGATIVAEGEGEAVLASELNRQAREEADPQPGDGTSRVTADGNGNQLRTEPGPQSETFTSDRTDSGDSRPARKPRGARSAGNATAEGSGQTETPSDAPTE